MTVILIIALCLLVSFLLGIWLGRFCALSREPDFYGDKRWGE
jgi:uncharacterized protein YneF (UPF0154 family)